MSRSDASSRRRAHCSRRYHANPATTSGPFTCTSCPPNRGAQRSRRATRAPVRCALVVQHAVGLADLKIFGATILNAESVSLFSRVAMGPSRSCGERVRFHVPRTSGSRHRRSSPLTMWTAATLLSLRQEPRPCRHRSRESWRIAASSLDRIRRSTIQHRFSRGASYERRTFSASSASPLRAAPTTGRDR